MKEKGFTLVEIIIGLSIVSIIVTICLEFYISNYRYYLKLSNEVDEEVNLRIAIEYLYDVIMSSQGVELVKNVGNIKTFVNEIDVESGATQPEQYLFADNKKIYIVNDIIRCDQNSNHVVSNIKEFSIKRRGLVIYIITVKSQNHSLKTNIYKRK